MLLRRSVPHGCSVSAAAARGSFPRSAATCDAATHSGDSLADGRGGISSARNTHGHMVLQVDGALCIVDSAAARALQSQSAHMLKATLRFIVMRVQTGRMCQYRGCGCVAACRSPEPSRRTASTRHAPSGGRRARRHASTASCMCTWITAALWQPAPGSAPECTVATCQHTIRTWCRLHKQLRHTARQAKGPMPLRRAIAQQCHQHPILPC